MAKSKNFTGQLDLICGDDILRPAMHHISFIDGFAYATNAHLGLRTSLKKHNFTDEEISIMNGKFIHKNAFKEIYKYDHIIVEADGFHCMKNEVKCVYPFSYEEQKFPDLEKAIKDLIDSPIDCVSDINFDIRYFEKIRKAFFMDGISFMKMTFYGRRKGCIIASTESDYPKDLILLMPTAPN